MFKDTKRALRRHHKERMKRKAIRVYYFCSPEEAIKSADNLKLCSCHMCGNQRKYYGVPLKEIPLAQDWDLAYDEE